MSKSLGNLVFVGDLLKDWEPAAIRVALLDHHYRPDWEWTSQDMPNAARRLERWRAVRPAGARRIRGTGTRPSTPSRPFLDEDLDTPGALAALDELASAGHQVVWGADLLGVTL